MESMRDDEQRNNLRSSLVLPPGDGKLPGFPNAQKVKPKTRFPGGLRRRWKIPSGDILEWDYRHGHIEAYNRRGEHVGEFDFRTGQQIGPAVPDRKVEP